MKLRYSVLFYVLILLGINSWGLNQYSDTGTNIKITFFIIMFALTSIGLCLALQTLKSIGTIPIFAFTFGLTLGQIGYHPVTGISIILILDFLSLFALYLPKTIDLLSRTVGAENERIFLLTKPKAISIVSALAWVFFWIDLLFLFKNLSESHYLLATPLAIMAIFIFAIFFFSTRNLANRRVVIVPNGIVICDPITLTDTILLPLSKLKDVNTISLENFIKNHRKKIKGEDSTSYIGNIGFSNVTRITLIEKTDSFIVRKNHKTTERQDVDELFISLESTEAFRKYFHLRFHKAGEVPQASDPKKDKIEMLKMEKELGIETAPKSDAKLPEWRKKS